MMIVELNCLHLQMQYGKLWSVSFSSSSDCCAHHLLQSSLTYNHLTNVDTPASLLPATSSTSHLQRSTETLPSIYFDKLAIVHLMSPEAMLNNTCINKGLQLLLSHFQPEHSDKCAIFSTYTMTYIKQEANDNTLWRNIHCRVYWEKLIWIIPVHMQHPYLHWTLCIINMNSTTIQLFDSIANKSLWMDDVKVSDIDTYTSY